SYAIGPMVADRIRSKTIGGAAVPGTQIDQKSHGTPREANGHPFPGPHPPNGGPVHLPHTTKNETLNLPRPPPTHTSTPSQNPPTAAQVDAIENGTIKQTANVIVNNSVSSIYILFDRNMDPTTFNNPASVLSFIGINGPITGTFTITPNPVGTDP